MMGVWKGKMKVLMMEARLGIGWGGSLVGTMDGLMALPMASTMAWMTDSQLVERLEKKKAVKLEAWTD